MTKCMWCLGSVPEAEPTWPPLPTSQRLCHFALLFVPFGISPVGSCCLPVCCQLQEGRDPSVTFRLNIWPPWQFLRHRTSSGKWGSG